MLCCPLDFLVAISASAQLQLGVPTLPDLLGPSSFRALGRPLTGLLSLLRNWNLPFRKSLASPVLMSLGFSSDR